MVKAARPAVAEATRVDEPPFTPAGDAKLCKTLLMLLIAAALLSSGESVAFVSATRVPLRVRVPLFGTFEILRLELSFDVKRSTSFVRGARGLLILVVAIHEEYTLFGHGRRPKVHKTNVTVFIYALFG